MPRARTDECTQTLSHFSCRLVGEGDGKNLPRSGFILPDEVPDTIGKHTGFAASGSCQHQKRPFCAEDRFFLGGIERFYIKWHMCLSSHTL